MTAYEIKPPGGGAPILMSQIATGEDTVMPFLFIQYPHRKTPEMMIAMKGHNVRCLDCQQDIPKTIRRTKHRQRRIVDHVISHDRRKRVWLTEVEA